MNPPIPLQELRQLNAEERAAIAAYFAREGYPGLMFVPTEPGKKVENTEE